MARYRRKHFFIDKEFQGRYIFSAFISIVAGSAMFALIFGFFSSNTLSIVYENYHLRLGATPTLLLNRIFSAQWLFILIGGVAVGVMVLFLSHRVAGPFYRFEKTLDKMMGGDYSERIHLRKRDEGKILGEKINGFNDMLSVRLENMRKTAEQIEECCDALEAGPGEEGRYDRRPAVFEMIRQLNQSCLDSIGEFKLK